MSNCCVILMNNNLKMICLCSILLKKIYSHTPPPFCF